MLKLFLSTFFEPFLIRLIWALIGFTLAFFFLKDCGQFVNKQDETADTTIEKTTEEYQISLEGVWGSLEPDTVKKGYPVYQDTTQFDTTAFLAQLDTLALLRDYFKRRFYSRELADSNVKVLVKAQVARNRLDSLKLESKLTHTREMIKKTISKPQRPTITPILSAGVGQYEPGLLYHHSGWVFGAGFNFGRRASNSLRIKVGHSF